MNLSLRLIENITGERRTLKKKITSTPKPAIQLCNNGLQIPFLDHSQLT